MIVATLLSTNSMAASAVFADAAIGPDSVGFAWDYSKLENAGARAYKLCVSNGGNVCKAVMLNPIGGWFAIVASEGRFDVASGYQNATDAINSALVMCNKVSTNKCYVKVLEFDSKTDTDAADRLRAAQITDQAKQLQR